MTTHAPTVAFSGIDCLMLAEDGGPALDLRDIKGQKGTERALEVAAAGNHTLLGLWPITPEKSSDLSVHTSTAHRGTEC
ncbi:MAG: ATP-binding protein [Magnetospirillum sp.]|nr:ATP-binding protein [Magnetospirillum sp.]